jgi:PAS domain S-box-containing protein
MTAWTASLQTGEPYEIEFRLRQAGTGAYRWHLTRALPMRDEAGRIVKWIGTNTDITGRRQAEDALRTTHTELEQRVVERTAQLALANRSLQDEIAERKHVEEAVRDSELQYKLLTEATFDGIAIHDQGILIEMNAGLERIFGYGPDELIGRSLWDLVADESHDLVLANMQNGVNGPYEAMGRRKDGTTFFGEVVVRPCRYRGKEVRLVAGRDITERKHLEAERSRHTEELKHQIAERTVEIAKLESQRAQTEKLAAMGRLAAGVAHEINNPIAGIKNAFTLVKQAVDPVHPHAEFVDMIDREIARVASIVQNMYQLYRPESGKGEAVELRTMINDIEALFAKRLQQRRLVLTIDVDPGLDRFRVPRGDLLQVLLNLLNNAIDFSSEGGTIALTLRAEPDAIRIAVSDQGPGIPPEHFPHIFDPFFTTKTGGDQKGMGLGLSISQSLVMAMGGKIEVQTQPNDGSTFSIILPRHTAVACAHDRSNIIKEVVTP